MSFFFREGRGDFKKLRQFLSQKNLILLCFLIFFENVEVKLLIFFVLRSKHVFDEFEYKFCYIFLVLLAELFYDFFELLFVLFQIYEFHD